MKAPIGMKMRGSRLAPVILLALLFLTMPFRSTPANAQTAVELKVGPVSALAIDNIGGGWGWTGPANPNDSGHLIRLNGGMWVEVSRSDPASGQLGTAAAIYDIALTGDGKSGWAIGTGGGPRLWQLKDGAWIDAPLPFGRDLVWDDLALSADGTEGWVVASDTALNSTLGRLQNGQWARVDNPAGVKIRYISLSPDGAHGWGVGVNGTSKNVAIRLDKSGWVGSAFEVQQNLLHVTADNLGNGWALATGVNSALFRLTPDGVQQLLPNPLSEQPDLYTDLSLQSIKVNGMGRGWLTGTYKRALNPVLDVEPVNQPLLFWLNGDSFTDVATNEITPTPQTMAPNYAGPIAVSPDGAHAWTAISTGDSRFVAMLQLKEGWNKGKIEQAEPLPGAGLCFNESPYCLRGLFADFWQKNGGLDSLGYPITPEIYEITRKPQIGGPLKMVVQYTERARIEWHPDLEGTPHEALLGLLGNSLVESRLSEEPFKPKPASATPTALWFEPTQHNLDVPFVDYWQQYGGLPVFGYPRSEKFEEKSQADGKTYLVQYFERNRIEYHPENKGTKYEYLLGLLGVEQFKATYGFAP